jgi:apolipoprotein N-acyltransferase
VWPESAVGFYLREHPSAERALFDLTRELGSELILGGQHYRLSKGRTYHHNSVFLVRDGAMAGRYDKLRLLPFAEERWFGIGRPAPTYSPGERLVALHTNHGAIGAFICFEAMYPDFARALVLEGAVVLLNLSNDVWFGYPAAARHQFDIALLRAIENRRYLVRASESGVSAVIDPYGRIVTSTRFGERGIISTRVTPVRDLTLYQRWGDLLAALAIAYAVAATLRGVLRPKGGDSPIARPAGLRLGRRRGGH